MRLLACLACVLLSCVGVLGTSPYRICARGDTRIAPENTLPALLACLVEFETIDASLAGPTVYISTSSMVLADNSVLLNHDPQVTFDAHLKLVILNPTPEDTQKFPLINIQSYTRPLVSTWRVLDRVTGKVAKMAFLDELFEVLQVFDRRSFILDYDIKDATYEPPAVAEFLSNLNVTDEASLDLALEGLVGLLQENLAGDATSNAIVNILLDFPFMIPHSLLEATNPLINLDLIFLTQAYSINPLIAFNYDDWGSQLLDELEVGVLMPTVKLETTFGLRQAVFFESFLVAAGCSSVIQAYHAAGINTIGVPLVNNDFTVLEGCGVDYVYFSL